MTFRRILTASLLAFVAASVVTLAVREFRGNGFYAGKSAGIGTGGAAEGGQVIAYYFTGKVRCTTCRTIEEISRKTIESGFSRELGDGRLRFLVVNFDRPENRHFIEEFRLESSSLVLVAVRDGRPARWKNLPEVWTLADDPPKLEAYVREEVAAMMRGA